MVKSKELMEAITRVKNQVKTANPSESSVVRYNSEGKNDKSKKKKFSDNETCALEVTVGRNKIYKVKSKRGGQLYNPLNVGMVYSLDLIDRITNEPMFQFKEVNAAAFDAYVNFLAKRHDSLLIVAERESVHG